MLLEAGANFALFKSIFSILEKLLAFLWLLIDEFALYVMIVCVVMMIVINFLSRLGLFSLIENKEKKYTNYTSDKFNEYYAIRNFYRIIEYIVFDFFLVYLTLAVIIQDQQYLRFTTLFPVDYTLTNLLLLIAFIINGIVLLINIYHSLFYLNVPIDSFSIDKDDIDMYYFIETVENRVNATSKYEFSFVKSKYDTSTVQYLILKQEFFKNNYEETNQGSRMAFPNTTWKSSNFIIIYKSDNWNDISYAFEQLKKRYDNDN